MTDRFFARWVISLARTPLRLQEFRNHWPESLGPQPMTWVAWDGTEKLPPETWMKPPGQKVSDTVRRGAYGCWRSHLGILHWAVDHGILEQEKPLLVFEDDAIIIAPERIESFLNLLPRAWQIAYLGCQHEREYEQIGDTIVRAIGPGRTHAMIINPKFIPELLRLWESHETHVDWTLRDNGWRYNFYAPLPNIAAQMANDSEMVGRREPMRDWNPLRRSPIVLLKCSAEIADQLRDKELIHTGFDFLDNNCSANLKNICDNFFDKGSERDAIMHLAFAQFVFGGPTQVGIRTETNMMPRSACAIWNPDFDVFRFKPLLPTAYLVEALTAMEAAVQIAGILSATDETAPNEPKRFVHSGKLGDIIYALPTIREMGGGILILAPDACAGDLLTRDGFENIKPLLLEQPYIRAVEYCPKMEPDPRVVNLNYWRWPNRPGKNLAEFVLGRFGKRLAAADAAWISVKQPWRVSSVVINRTDRYHGGVQFGWDKVLAQYPHAVFVGTHTEWASFVAEFGYITHWPTENLLELASVIAGCDLFVGNQSCAQAIAEGLKKPLILEKPTETFTTFFDRPDAKYLARFVSDREVEDDKVPL